jgi:hypothetical protein
MWARTIELMLGVWLVLSPFVFRGTLGVEDFWSRDVCTGTAVILLSLLSFWSPLRRSRLATGVLAFGLVVSAWLAAVRPGPPAAQNEIVVGLLLLMLTIVPNEASLPPESWRRPRAVTGTNG